MPKKRSKEMVAPEQVVALADLRDDPNNAKVHGDKSIEALKGSLRQFGQVEPLVVQARTLRIIGGHGRAEAMRQMGWTKVRVIAVEVDDLHATALGLAMNQTPTVGTAWDRDRVKEQLEMLHGDGFEIENIGFTAEDMEALGHPEPFYSPQDGQGDGEPSEVRIQDTEVEKDILDADALEEPDIPDPPADPITKRGDIWQMGEHRLMCGDSTCAEDVVTLTQGDTASLVFTSPPYSQQRDYGKKITDWDALMRGVFSQLPVENISQILVNLGMIHDDGQWIPYWDSWIEWMHSCGWRKFGWYVWDQGGGLPGQFGGRCSPAHEFIFHFNKEGKINKSHACKHAGSVSKAGSMGVQGWEYREGQRVTGESKIPGSVFHVARQGGQNTGHPAAFPIGLPAEAISAFSDRGDCVYEPFSGSGTTLLASEQLSRRCRAMELEPAYCDIAVQRWEKLTGKKAELISSGAGDAQAAG